MLVSVAAPLLNYYVCPVRASGLGEVAKSLFCLSQSPEIVVEMGTQNIDFPDKEIRTQGYQANVYEEEMVLRQQPVSESVCGRAHGWGHTLLRSYFYSHLCCVTLHICSSHSELLIEPP